MNGHHQCDTAETDLWQQTLLVQQRKHAKRLLYQGHTLGIVDKLHLVSADAPHRRYVDSGPRNAFGFVGLLLDFEHELEKLCVQLFVGICNKRSHATKNHTNDVYN